MKFGHYEVKALRKVILICIDMPGLFLFQFFFTLLLEFCVHHMYKKFIQKRNFLFLCSWLLCFVSVSYTHDQKWRFPYMKNLYPYMNDSFILMKSIWLYVWLYVRKGRTMFCPYEVNLGCFFRNIYIIY